MPIEGRLPLKARMNAQFQAQFQAYKAERLRREVVITSAIFFALVLAVGFTLAELLWAIPRRSDALEARIRKLEGK